MWTLEKAKEDYKKNHPIKCKKDNKHCENCMFSDSAMTDESTMIQCKVKDTFILFPTINANICKYYEKRKEHKEEPMDYDLSKYEGWTQEQKDTLRRSTLYEGETLYVVYTGKAANFPRMKKIRAFPRAVRKSLLPYPLPKWQPCDYYIKDLDDDYFSVAEERFGKLYPGFVWQKED